MNVTPLQFITQFRRSAAPENMRHWLCLPIQPEEAKKKLLKPDEAIRLYQQWKTGSLKVDIAKCQPVRLEVAAADETLTSYFYQFPLDLPYLFSGQWRADNLHWPFGFLRWCVEMDTALRLNLVPEYAGRRIGDSLVITIAGAVTELEGGKAGYQQACFSWSRILDLQVLLTELNYQGRLGIFYGNSKQIELADALLISHLSRLYKVLSYLTNEKGASWTAVLEYKRIDAPVAKVRGFFGLFVAFVEHHPLLTYSGFKMVFARLLARACQRRFNNIKANYEMVEVVLNQARREDWPSQVYDYLQRTLPFFASAD